MTGLVPTTGFLGKDFRPRLYNPPSVPYTEGQIKRDMKNRRTMMLYNFCQLSGRNAAASDNEDDGRTLRSDVSDDDDWMIDSAALEMTTTDRRRLARYCLEQLLISR